MRYAFKDLFLQLAAGITNVYCIFYFYLDRQHHLVIHQLAADRIFKQAAAIVQYDGILFIDRNLRNRREHRSVQRHDTDIRL